MLVQTRSFSGGTATFPARDLWTKQWLKTLNKGQMLRLSGSFAFCVNAASSPGAFSPPSPPPNAGYLTQRMNEVPVLPQTDPGCY